jgi:hypothetical protein
MALQRAVGIEIYRTLVAGHAEQPVADTIADTAQAPNGHRVVTVSTGITRHASAPLQYSVVEWLVEGHVGHVKISIK